MSEAPVSDNVPPVETSGGAQNTTPQQSRPRGNQNSKRKNNRIITTNGQSYQGECEDIGYILALRSKKFDKKSSIPSVFRKIGKIYSFKSKRRWRHPAPVRNLNRSK